MRERAYLFFCLVFFFCFLPGNLAEHEEKVLHGEPGPICQLSLADIRVHGSLAGRTDEQQQQQQHNNNKTKKVRTAPPFGGQIIDVGYFCSSTRVKKSRVFTIYQILWKMQ